MLDIHQEFQECQNCRFFKRIWEKVRKRAYVQVYRPYYDLTEKENNPAFTGDLMDIRRT